MDPACVISPADRASFRRCRRQWDFAARPRRNLEPLAARPDLERAVRDTLAVYYFPGMWDWDPSITRPLVVQGLERALAGQPELLATAPAGPLLQLGTGPGPVQPGPGRAGI